MNYLEYIRKEKNLPDDQQWIFDNCIYLAIHGSRAYGIDHAESDIDLYGITIPPYEVVYPFEQNNKNCIYGFDIKFPKFEQYLVDHLPYENTEIDCQIFNIVKYFRLCADGNPNMIDSLFVKTEDVIVSSAIGDLLRKNRKLFLSKKCFMTFKGYAYSQLKKADKPRSGRRKEIVEKYGYDLKFASHIFRLLNEVDQVMDEHDIDLHKGNDLLIRIRNAEFKWEELKEMFYAREKILDQKFANSTLRETADMDEIRALLAKCLDMHFAK